MVKPNGLFCYTDQEALAKCEKELYDDHKASSEKMAEEHQNEIAPCFTHSIMH